MQEKGDYMDRRIEKTKAAIWDAYIQILMEGKGNKKVTVTEIARKANIDRKTFYLHYDSVEDVMKEYCGQMVAQCMARLKNEMDGGKVFSVKLLFEVFNQFIAGNMDLFEILSLQKDGNYFWQEIKNMTAAALRFVAKEQLSFTETQLYVFCEFYMSGIISVYTLWIQNKIPVPAEELAEMVKNAAVKGLERMVEETGNEDN